MGNIKNALILISLLFIFNSCSVIAKLTGIVLGLKEPRVETEKSIITYLLKHKIDTNNIFITDSATIMNLTKLPYKPEWEVGLRPIQMKCLDSNGKLIMQYSSCEGSRKRMGILDTFPPKNVFPFDSTISILEEIKNYKTLNGEIINIAEWKHFDYTIIVYWAKWTGLPGRKLLKDIKNYTKKYPDYKFNVLKVNLDFLNKQE